MTTLKEIPLFPLGVVLFPGTLLPIHIFEERYKTLINGCLESGRAFGVIYYTGENFYSTGCSAIVQSVVKKYKDGRMIILTQGQERFRIDAITGDKPYLTGRVEFFDDDPVSDTAELTALSKLALALFRDSLQLNKENQKLDIPETVDAKFLSFLIVAHSDFTLDEKQAFLEMRSTPDRLSRITLALRKLITRQKASREIAGIISGNGFLKNKKME